MSNQNLKNKSIDELREMLSKGEAELKVLHNKSKYYESQINLLTRKERTHRLCTRGATLEKFLGCPDELTDEQVEEILKIVFKSEAVGRAIVLPAFVILLIHFSFLFLRSLHSFLDDLWVWGYTLVLSISFYDFVGLLIV